MSVWLTVYCTRPVDHVTAADLTAAVEAADVHTDAEVWGVEDEDVIDDALMQLSIQPVSGEEGVGFRLRYAAADRPPVLVRVSDRSHADEALDEIGDAPEPGASRVRDVLERAVAVVSLPLKAQHLKDMGIVLASRVAETFAAAGDGLIRDQNDEWWAVADGAPTLVLGQSGDE